MEVEPTAHVVVRADGIDDEGRWAAVLRRDPAADTRFFYSVKTTGVYCRPSCAARPARRENVAFHDSRDGAERAGFRPCKRCRPDQAPIAERRAAMVAEACRRIDAAEDPPSLDALAAAAGMSRFHFHRVFQAVTGLTPKRYAAARRLERVRAALARGTTVTEAIYAAAFNSSGRFYATATGALGMRPATFRRGAPGEEIRYAVAACSLGRVLVAATAAGVCAILLGRDADELVRDLRRRFARARLIGADGSFERQVARVVALVESPRLGLDLPLDLRGTTFQQRVWRAMLEIPAGSTLRYAELARRIGAPRAVRAVARACAANAVAIAVPCHRVVRGDGGLAGYRWGLERKRALLRRKGVA